jgi:hypothetical protein
MYDLLQNPKYAPLPTIIGQQYGYGRKTVKSGEGFMIIQSLRKLRKSQNNALNHKQYHEDGTKAHKNLQTSVKNFVTFMVKQNEQK